MQRITLFIIATAAIWLLAIAVLMAARPSYCLQLFQKMTAELEASNRRLHVTEQALRVLAGAAMIIRSPASKLPLVFEVVGWFLVASSLLVMAAPVRWHGAYGAWWVRRVTPLAIRFLSPVPAVIGAGLIYAAI